MCLRGQERWLPRPPCVPLGRWWWTGFWKGLLYPLGFSSNCGVVFSLSILLLPAFPVSWHADIRCPNLVSLCLDVEICQTLFSWGKKKRESVRHFLSAPGVGAKKWQVLIFVSMTAVIKCYFFISLWICIFTVSFQTAGAQRWEVFQLVLYVGSWKESQAGLSALGRVGWLSSG